MEKVLLITYYWPPSGGAGVQRALKFVKYFRTYGLEPLVLTVHPDKASYPVMDYTLLEDVPADVKVYYASSFEPLNILSSLVGKKNVPYGGFANANKDSFTQKLLRWVRGNFFIPDARVGWVNAAVRAATEIIQKNGIRSVMISSPPHSSQLIGLKLKRVFRDLKWVADMRDPWTDIYYYKDLLHTGIAAAKDARLEREVLSSADEVVVVSDAIRTSFLKKRADLPMQKFHVLPNGYDEDDFREAPLPVAGKFIITYVGTLADSYRPEIFFNAFRELVAAEKNAKVLFRFVGNTPWTIRKSIEESGLSDYCEWIGHVSHKEAVHYMTSSHALLLIIPDTVGAEGILTGKLFEYLGAHRNIIGIGPPTGDAAAIIHRCAAGRMFGRTEGAELLEWMSSLYAAHLNGKSYVAGNTKVDEYQRSNLTAVMASLLKSNYAKIV
jgi:glycosyltransferase involved in cell wall biosynthesis